MAAGGAGGGVVAACRGTTAGAGTTGVVCATACVVGGAVVVVWTGAAWTGVCDVGDGDGDGDGDGVGVVVVGGVLGGVDSARVLVGGSVSVVVGATWRTVAAGVGVGVSAPPVSRTAKAAAMTRPAVLRVLIRAQPRRPRISAMRPRTKTVNPTKIKAVLMCCFPLAPHAVPGANTVCTSASSRERHRDGHSLTSTAVCGSAP